MRSSAPSCSSLPAGYGKTTLVAQWLARHRAAGRAAAWVALDSGDNDPARLWTHVTAALQRAGRLDVIEDVVPGLGDVRDEALRRMVSALSSTSEESVILLDDFDVIREPRCHSQVELLIENLPPQAHLVIITRADPGLRLGRIRASGQLAEIRAEDLCFTLSEVVTLTEIEGVRLTPEGVGLLVERTEGWPAGIYLACLALSGKPDPDEFVRQLSGGSRFIGDYFAEEVLSRDAETGEFVRSMSVVERFTAPLCDALLGKSGSATDPSRPGARQPLPGPARREPPLVPVPSPVGGRGACWSSRAWTPTRSWTCMHAPHDGSATTGTSTKRSGTRCPAAAHERRRTSFRPTG